MEAPPVKTRIRPDVSCGTVVLCRYEDAVFFKDSEISNYKPWVREVVGWLEFENEHFVRIVWERTPVPMAENSRMLSTGLTIPRANVLELRRLA